MSSSAFSPTLTVTGGTTQQGEINIITNPIAQSNTSDWTTSNATLSRVATGSPLDPEIPTGFQAVSTTTTTSYVQTALQNVAPSLRNRKLKVQFYLALTDSTSWKVDVFKSDGVTRYPLSTDSSGVTVIPALTGTFTTTFDMDTSTGIYVRFTRHAGAGTSTLNFTNLIVGPGIQPQGAAVQYLGTLSFTPNNFGTFSNNRFDVWRNGSSMRVSGKFTVGTAVSATASLTLPSGFTLDLTALGSVTKKVGTYQSTRTTTGTLVPGDLFFDGSTNNSIFFAASAGATSGQYNKDTGTTVAYNSGTIDLILDIPIAEWAGSGTVQLAQNDVEFASNGSTFDSTDITTPTFVYGPAGAGPTTALTALRTKRIRFQRPVQSGDKLTLEFSTDRTRWFSAQGFNDGAGNAFVPAYDSTGSGSASAGAFLIPVSGSATDIDVQFFRYINIANDDAPTSNWPTTWYWRVRKSSAGAAVGFGIVQGTSAGLVPASNTNFDDVTATRLGLKQYLHGTTYNGGIAPTVTCSQAGFAVTRAVFIPYQLQDGIWRLRFNLLCSFTSATITSLTVSINGITTISIQQVILSNFNNSTTNYGYFVASGNTITFVGSGLAETGIKSFGDIELSSKPTWAY